MKNQTGQSLLEYGILVGSLASISTLVITNINLVTSDYFQWIVSKLF